MSGTEAEPVKSTFAGTFRNLYDEYCDAAHSASVYAAPGRDISAEKRQTLRDSAADLKTRLVDLVADELRSTSSDERYAVIATVEQLLHENTANMRGAGTLTSPGGHVVFWQMVAAKAAGGDEAPKEDEITAATRARVENVGEEPS